jgi:hypothetical protein
MITIMATARRARSIGTMGMVVDITITTMCRHVSVGTIGITMCTTGMPGIIRTTVARDIGEMRCGGMR